MSFSFIELIYCINLAIFVAGKLFMPITQIQHSMKKILFFCLSLIGFYLSAQTTFRTQTFNNNIKTLQAEIVGEQFVLPVLLLNGDQKLKISFDEMSHDAHSYAYKVLHCNSDWTYSNLSTTEYISGFTTGNIYDYALSVNTTFLYTHYQFELPNTDMNFKISGNFVVIIYEDNNEDKPIAQVCFSVVDPQVSIMATIRGNTDIELNRRLQQLDFDVVLNGYSVRDVDAEIKIIVRQNNRYDNEVSGIKPSFMSGSKLSYINNKALIFEGGNEYQRFDISSVYAAGEGVDDIQFDKQHYNVMLSENKIQTSNTYINDMDVNGRYVVNLQNSTGDDNFNADYMYVDFKLVAPTPFFDGLVYLGGDFNFNLINNASRMKFDTDLLAYTQRILLKQGGYNFQYWFVQKGTTKANVERVDGSYWQTKNEYTVYVYHRPWGERYDKLIAVKSVE